MTDAPAKQTLTPDLCVIGGDPAGLSVAMAAAAFGASAVVIRGDAPAVLPWTTLVAAGRRAADIRAAASFGLDARLDAVDRARIRARARAVAAAAAPNEAPARFEAMGIRVISAAPRFADKRTVEAVAVRVRARRFVLATGSKPAIPPISGLEGVPFLTADTIVDLAETPQHLIVIGAGATGLALAQAHARLGSRVTVIDAGRALRREDPEMTALLLARLAAEGVDLRQETRIASVAADGAVRVVLAGGETIEGSHLLLAAGRKPAIDGLGLEKAGIAGDATGAIVDDRLRTANRRVLAIGACAAGQPHSAHVAARHAEIVTRAILFRLPGRLDPRAIPRLVLTDPEIATCGLSEAEAQAAGGVLIQRWPFADNDRARAESAIDGHVKAIATQKGRILGATILGRQAGELLPMWSFAIAGKRRLSDLAGLAIPAPTMSEASKRAAAGALAALAQNPLLRAAASLLRRFG